MWGPPRRLISPSGDPALRLSLRSSLFALGLSAVSVGRYGDLSSASPPVSVGRQGDLSSASPPVRQASVPFTFPPATARGKPARCFPLGDLPIHSQRAGAGDGAVDPFDGAGDDGDS